jgi:hypothetical protein
MRRTLEFGIACLVILCNMGFLSFHLIHARLFSIGRDGALAVYIWHGCLNITQKHCSFSKASERADA